MFVAKAAASEIMKPFPMQLVCFAKFHQRVGTFSLANVPFVQQPEVLYRQFILRHRVRVPEQNRHDLQVSSIIAY